MNFKSNQFNGYYIDAQLKFLSSFLMKREWAAKTIWNPKFGGFQRDIKKHFS